MPRYRYKCLDCQETNTFRLLVGQEPDTCLSCGEQSKLQRDFSSLFNISSKGATGENNQPVGTLTKEYIEENRKILEEEKQVAAKGEYEST
jgi:hypothetical protein